MKTIDENKQNSFAWREEDQEKKRWRRKSDGNATMAAVEAMERIYQKKQWTQQAV